MKKSKEQYLKELAKIVPAETYSRNAYGGTTRRMKLSEEEIEDLFNFVSKTIDQVKADTEKEMIVIVDEILEKSTGKYSSTINSVAYADIMFADTIFKRKDLIMKDIQSLRTGEEK